jgi:hypothetical protein
VHSVRADTLPILPAQQHARHAFQEKCSQARGRHRARCVQIRHSHPSLPVRLAKSARQGSSRTEQLRLVVYLVCLDGLRLKSGNPTAMCALKAISKTPHRRQCANGVPLVVSRLPRGALAALIVNPAGLVMQAIATAELNARPVRMGGIEKKNIMMQPRKSLLACLFGGNCTVHAHPAHNLYPYTWPDIVCPLPRYFGH